MEQAMGERRAVPIAPRDIRYIKLGQGGEWERVSLTRGEVHFGHGDVSHELALSGDEGSIRQRFIALGRRGGAATRAAHEVLDFYQLGADIAQSMFD